MLPSMHIEAAFAAISAVASCKQGTVHGDRCSASALMIVLKLYTQSLELDNCLRRVVLMQRNVLRLQ